MESNGMPGVRYVNQSYIVGGGNVSQYYIGEQPLDYLADISPTDNVSAGTPNFGLSSSSCSVRTDKKRYGIGELITIQYSVSFPCTIQTTISGPNGTASALGVMNTYPGTFSQAEIASGPLGIYNVLLQAVDEGVQCNAGCAYTVEGPAPFNRTNSPGRNSSQGNGSSMYRINNPE
ncbi:MAG: hypothetical protein ACE14P_02635 [Methanotrichaceae archaeon]